LHLCLVFLIMFALSIVARINVERDSNIKWTHYLGFELLYHPAPKILV
jgi:hypothetical protein